MITLNWPIVLVTTLVLYIGIILTLPLSPLYATLFLYTLIGFWSRLPGVGIPHPFFIIYQMDVIDLFMILIAVNLSPVHAIIFVWFTNTISRLAGTFPDWAGVMQDNILMTFAAVVAPFASAILGGNLILLIALYSIFRPIGFFIFWFIWPRTSLAERILNSLIGGASIFFINAFYAKLFGNFFDNLLNKGVAFSWILFFFATIIIFLFYIIVFSTSASKNVNSSNKIVKRIVRKIIHKKKKKKRKSVPIKPINQDNFIQ
jgi:hypothetical protein